MKLFDDFIKENSTEFDDLEPENNHFERFEHKLNVSDKSKKFGFRTLLKVAVVVIPLCVIGLLIMYSKSDFDKKDNAKLVYENKIPTELKNIEIYFTDKISKNLVEFENLKCRIEETDKAKIFEDLNEIDNSIACLTVEFSNSSKNEKIMNAIILNYRAKNEILEKVITKIKENC